MNFEGLKVELGFLSVGDSFNCIEVGLLTHQTSKNSPISFWTKNSLWMYELRGFEGGTRIPKHGGPLNSTGAWLLNQQTSKNSPNGGGIGDLCRGRGKKRYYRAWRGSGAWYWNPRDDLRVSIRSRRRGALELTGKHNGPIITGSSKACGCW